MAQVTSKNLQTAQVISILLPRFSVTTPTCPHTVQVFKEFYSGSQHPLIGFSRKTTACGQSPLTPRLVQL